MLKGQDIPVLLRIAEGDRAEWRLQDVARDLGMSPSAIHRSLNRLTEAGLIDGRKRRVNRPQAHEFLSHGLRYVFPPQFGGETRGIPTAWAAPPLEGRLAPSASLPPVWPHPLGKSRGIALEPLHRSVPDAALKDETLGEGLSLVDALRVGDARLRGEASSALKKWLSR